MQVYRDTGKIPDFRNGVVTIGTFDGVHTGHRQIIAQLKEEANQIDGETVIITFHPHPRRVVGDASRSVQLLNTIEEKTALLAEAGIDHLVICPFTEHFSQLTAEEYITEFLLKKFNPRTIVIGYDHRFGQGRKGDYKLLEDFSEKYAFRLKEIPAHIINESTVSSTGIRKALLAGDTDTASKLLGYDYFFQGKVIEGNKLGRTLGYPTANLDVENPEKLIPGNGVYAVSVELDEPGDHVAGKFLKYSTGYIDKMHLDKLHAGMMNIGVRPTVDHSARRTIEINLLNFDGDLYGRTLTVYLRKFLRPELKFSGLDALKQQLATDRQQALQILRT
ncbi:bifunctional riboflavin kinase/FAD synthetase [Flavitalea antarctica]